MARAKNIEEKVTENKKFTTEELILGETPVVETKIIKKYEDESIIYKITNLQTKNKSIQVTGELVETFIGSGNKTAREELKAGAKKVVTVDGNGKNAYRIEVVE